MDMLAEEPTTLAAVLKERNAGAYVLTVTTDGRPHATYSPVRWQDERFVAEVGKQTARNAEARPLVTLLFPVRSPGDYSLIIDGTATVEPERGCLVVTPTRAVLHRAGTPSDASSACGADCVVLFPVSTTPINTQSKA